MSIADSVSPKGRLTRMPNPLTPPSRAPVAAAAAEDDDDAAAEEDRTEPREDVEEEEEAEGDNPAPVVTFCNGPDPLCAACEATMVATVASAFE